MPSVPDDPVTTTPAWQAARDLRMGIRSVLSHWSDSQLEISGLKGRVEVLDRQRRLRAKQVDALVEQMETALAARRTKEARERLRSLAFHLRYEREYATATVAKVRGMPNEFHPSVSLNLLQHWNTLAQCLPTTEDVPQGREQNVLRAIIAILRANNMGDLGAMTQVVSEQGANGA